MSQTSHEALAFPSPTQLTSGTPAPQPGVSSPALLELVRALARDAARESFRVALHAGGEAVRP